MRDGLLAVLCVLAAAACSYDWTVPPDAAVEGGPAGDASPDVRDATTDGVAPADGPGDAATDGTVVVETGPQTCTAAEEMTLQQDRAAAIDCTGITPMPCEVTVTDECGCTVVVGGENTAKASYVTAIMQLQQSGCIPSCPLPCGSAPQKGLCLVTDAGGTTLACVQ